MTSTTTLGKLDLGTGDVHPGGLIDRRWAESKQQKGALSMLVKLTEGFAVEELDGEFLVCDPGNGVVHRVPTDGAPWLADLLSGRVVEVDDAAALRHLLAAGILEPVADAAAAPGRRKVLAIAASATAATGLASLVLPAVAAAQSGPGPTPTTTTTTTIPPISEDGFFIGQQFLSGTYRNRLGISWFLLDEDGNATTPVPFTYEITGPITSTVSGSAPTGATGLILISGWTQGETVTVTVTATIAPNTQIVAPFLYQEPAFTGP